MKSPFHTSKRAFTLVEIMLVIGLIAMMGGLIIVGTVGMLRGLGERPVPEIFRKAVREARYQAADLKEPVELHYDGETASFVIVDASGQTRGSFDTGYGENANDIDVLFYEIMPGEGLDPESMDRPVLISQLRFLPDRSSTPFEVEFDLENEDFRQRYDPFSHIVIEDSRNL